MKAILKVYSLVLFIGLFSGSVMANQGEPMIEKKKTYSKSYPVGSSDRISFDNRFGELKINSWDKNEVKVDIVMVGKANSDQVAQEVLDRITIEDGKSSNGVYFKTKIGDGKKWPQGDKYNNTGFSIDYVVYLPSRNALTVENEFGQTIVPDHSGEITIVQKFGVLTAGKLSNVKKVHVEFSGGSTIESVTGGLIDFRFSRGQVNRLEGKVKANFEHSDAIKLTVDNSLTELTVNNSFTKLIIDASKSLSASFNVHTNFSQLDNNSTFSIKEHGANDEDRGPKFDHDYTGKSGSGTIPVIIKSEFGEVVIGHAVPFDVKAKEKNKDKKKERSI
ncbi:MAG: hypothetical protein H7Y31_16715 [Chitinophagaceae bacterium]|nr:hypothetical protein [Chitinophagaceae bacterium]